MKKLRFLLGVLAMSSALMIITKANAKSNKTTFPLCNYSPDNACLYRYDPVNGPIYIIDYEQYNP